MPQGGSPPPARLFSFCDLWQGFWDSLISAISAILAILSVLGWSWAALRAVLKHFAASWSGLGGLLEPLGVPLGGSWGLLGASWGLLGASWADLEGTKTSGKYNAKKDQLPDVKKENLVRLWGSILGSKIYPRWHPKRVKI